MSSLLQAFPDRPEWQRQVSRRLAASMGIAVLLLAALLLLVKFSPLPILQDTKVELRLLVDIEPPAIEPAEAKDLVVPEVVAEAVEPVEPSEPPELAKVIEPVEPQVRDWYADAENAVLETVVAANYVDSMHPAFDEKRRLAAINFRPSEAPVKKPIWENVETDQMGRKVLVSGDCYRVLEDWRATYQEIQRELGQYITYCNGNKEWPMDVAWVAGNKEGYAYLNYRDGNIPPDLVSDLTRRSVPLPQSHSGIAVQ